MGIPWIKQWQSYPCIRSQIEPSGSEGYLLFSVVPLCTSGSVKRCNVSFELSGDLLANDESMRSVVIGRPMDHTMAPKPLYPYQARATSA